MVDELYKDNVYAERKQEGKVSSKDNIRRKKLVNRRT